MIDVPPIDPDRERALLEAFDSYHARTPRRVRGAWLAAAAAITAGTAALVWIAAAATPGAPAIAPPPVELTGFVPWPGSQALPPFESGEVQRVEIAVSALPALGLPEPAAEVPVVQADLIIDRAGFARAVRLVSSTQSAQ